MVYTTRPLTKEDLALNNDLRKLMDTFNVTNDDLVIDKINGQKTASVFRKDGKPFEFSYKGDKHTYTNQDLRYISLEDLKAILLA